MNNMQRTSLDKISINTIIEDKTETSRVQATRAHNIILIPTPMIMP